MVPAELDAYEAYLATSEALREFPRAVYPEPSESCYPAYRPPHEDLYAYVAPAGRCYLLATTLGSFRQVTGTDSDVLGFDDDSSDAGEHLCPSFSACAFVQGSDVVIQLKGVVPNLQEHAGKITQTENAVSGIQEPADEAMQEKSVGTEVKDAVDGASPASLRAMLLNVDEHQHITLPQQYTAAPDKWTLGVCKVDTSFLESGKCLNRKPGPIVYQVLK